MNRTGAGNRGNRNRRRPTRPVDMERIHIVFCSVCREKITFSFNSVDKEGFRIACDLSGTKHIHQRRGGRKS
jgi:hypothetical protein